ncbi:B12-binding domain-containing radical SAM protein [Alkalibacter mobilis]|uniref:B12-binding domain-containing radical SAM protein n=1 Tax=Alkalibacter mobilis TaxID=2787712 RepID=UPI0018A04C08|nr:B12-binding domain-containing radical SAM protein [Alkalibacter mobilis]MBF7095541.1 DUF4080 domain-containing protein [Alkalibacter mobilis]
MKVVLASLNSKYIHTNLAVRSLKENCDVNDTSVHICEFTINDRLEQILGRLVEEKAQVYAFSIYIWNVDQTIRIISDLKKVMPNSIVVIGGPEVSFNPKEELIRTGADILAMGEGEIVFQNILRALVSDSDLSKINQIAYLMDGKIHVNGGIDILDMNTLKPAYGLVDIENLENRIIYYESSRGCPFSCAYCMSSVDKKLRFKNLDMVKEELAFFINSGVKQVKFVDRTFNCKSHRSKEIFKFLIENNASTNFHFEVAADLLDEESIEILSKAPPGTIQLEAGVQSVNRKTLNEINRVSDVDKIKNNVKRILSFNNVHVHLDLIAGLPLEDLDDFAHSFNEIIDLKPHMLQLGFLKILKGSPMMDLVKKHGYKYRGYSPYQVLCNDHMSYEDLLLLEKLEEVFERYYNTGNFRNTLEMVFESENETPFMFFRDLARHWDEKGYFNNGVSKDKTYEIFKDFLAIKGYNENLTDNLLRMDYLISAKWPLPIFLKKGTFNKETAFEMLKEQEFVEYYIPEFTGMTPKEIYKRVHFEDFELRPGKVGTALFYKSKKESLENKNEMVWVTES